MYPPRSGTRPVYTYVYFFIMKNEIIVFIVTGTVLHSLLLLKLSPARHNPIILFQEFLERWILQFNGWEVGTFSSSLPPIL